MSTLTSARLYRRLLSYVRPHWRVFAASLFGTTLAALTEPALPMLMKPLLDGTFVDKDPWLMKWMPVALVALFLVRGAASFIENYCSNWVATRVVLDLRDAMFRRLMALPVPWYDEQVTGTLVSRVAYDVTQVTSAATSAVTVAVKDSLTILGLLAWLFWLNWKLTLITLVVAPGITLIVRIFSRRLRRVGREVQHAMGEVTAVLQEGIDCQKVVKIFGGTSYETDRFHRAANRVRSFSMKYAAASAGNTSLVQLLAAIALAFVISIVAGQSAANETTVGGFVSFVTAMLMLLQPLKRLTGVNESLQRGLAAAESIFGLLDTEPEPDTGTVRLARARGDIAFEAVSMQYRRAERPALDNVTLTIRAGETVALVGPSGSGKTTLAHLIPRFYQPTAGRILLDGQDLRSLTLESLRGNIALVSQDVALFNDTVAANIAYGAGAGASEAEIVAAAEAAHAMGFIREMPQGLQTVVGENGVRLSGGQRQRLAIARTLLKNAPVLILDEATSALDSESERQVQAALEVLMKGRTTIVIAHRLSTIEKADRIAVLDRGRVAEVGSHAELLARDGIYARLHRIQFARTDSPGEALPGPQAGAPDPDHELALPPRDPY
ncbi:MAG: lipid A export permease/ATP-binding protein MsbA [Rhodocyclaceae bacterium]|jgi:subfamily B ATP-binding cassette protein MsbA|nr:lipid A export permease/ATP-binding protein MsbA [Rhodocyclaceae bacterium]MCA3147246.1 lipid A export permease/ATP-binding protein MsbA [Rhodocyclaceae bacterium]